MRLRSRGVAALVTAGVLACARAGGDVSTARTGGAAGGQDPLAGLRLGGDEVAARVGPFSWEAEVRWDVEKTGATPIRTVERHRVRQLADGTFEASSDIDPGAGPGSETGRHVVFTGGKVLARGRWGPYRERSTDRGEEARRHRDEAFRVAGDVAALVGPALQARLAGDATFLHRRARRYELSLAAVAPAVPPPAPPPGTDPDTARRRAFLDGRVPTVASGELIVDAETGVPLAATLHAAFTERADPEVRAEIDVSARMRGLGHDVAAVRAPQGALADERKPKGVARALEAAGLRKHAAQQPDREEEAGEEP